MSIKSHLDLLVWQKSKQLVTECYKLTEKVPDRERYGLTTHLQRAAVSIPANTPKVLRDDRPPPA